MEEQCRNWVAPCKMLPKIPNSSDFVVSPGDVKEVRKCVLPESDISCKNLQKICQCLQKYQVSSSEDIGHT